MLLSTLPMDLLRGCPMLISPPTMVLLICIRLVLGQWHTSTMPGSTAPDQPHTAYMLAETALYMAATSTHTVVVTAAPSSAATTLLVTFISQMQWSTLMGLDLQSATPWAFATSLTSLVMPHDHQLCSPMVPRPVSGKIAT